MEEDKFTRAIESRGIRVLENFVFKTNSECVNFLQKLDTLTRKGIKIDFFNFDLAQIIQKLEETEKNIDKLKRINWDDFLSSFQEKEEDQRKNKIYNNFIEFIGVELGVKKEYGTLIHDGLAKKDEGKSQNLDFLEKRADFNIEEDQKEKIERFKIGIKFDYNEPSKKRTVQDFTLYFNKRLQYFTDLLSSRISMENVTRISQLKNLYESNTEVSIIGLVSEITQTKNGHYIINIEDKSGSINCFVNKDKGELFRIVETLCLDEGVGIKGKVGKEIIWIDEIIIPSPPNTSELKKTDLEHYVAFISDLHFGAKVFQDEAFARFVDFMNASTGNDKLDSIAKQIKYLLVAGDMIEGIGIYPNQGKDARVLSTELQYHEAARWFAQIPKHIGIIMIPGNHDTDRLSEPQPKLPYEKAYALYNLPNVIMTSNPSIIRLFEDDPSGGLEFYMYHGGSIFYYADKIKYLREAGGAKVPEEVIKYLLEKRHIAPSHGSTLYIPDSQNDPLVIRKMPDFFVTGHTHKLAISNYKGCTIVSCGCWVEMSEYQQKMGMYPDIGKCPLINTRTRKPQIISFYKEKHKRDAEENLK